MVNSMTGFATLSGQIDGLSWVLEVKSVNARGLDLRMRLAEGGDVLEPLLKKEIMTVAKRGSVNVFLRTEHNATIGAPRLSEEGLANALGAVKRVETLAAETGQALVQSSATDILRLRGVYEPVVSSANTEMLVETLKPQIPDLIADFATNRAAEGAALKALLAEQIEVVGKLTQDAVGAAGARKAVVAARLQENLQLIMSQTDGLESDRLEQELALLAVKADVTEEIDRLGAHVDAAHALLSKAGPIGREFDFLMQEFNREANTLCSKAGSTELTRIGLDLKTVIDQMREQVQNVE